MITGQSQFFFLSKIRTKKTLTNQIVCCDQYATSEQQRRCESVVRPEYCIVDVGLVHQVTHLNEAGYRRQHREDGHCSLFYYTNTRRTNFRKNKVTTNFDVISARNHQGEKIVDSRLRKRKSSPFATGALGRGHEEVYAHAHTYTDNNRYPLSDVNSLPCCQFSLF